MTRKTKGRHSNPLFLILVEGYTEKIYFDSLWEQYPKRGFTIQIKKGKHGNPAPLINEALRSQQTGIYHQIWCVYDCDVFLQQDMREFERIHKAAEDRGIQFAESMLSIETWFLLHFIKPKQVYQSGEALINDLQNYIPAYCKEQRWLERNLYETLHPNEYNALENVTGFSTIDYKQPNTATTVNELVEIFVKRGRI